MIDVAHAFQEEDEHGRDAHLRYWYGTVRPSEDFEEDDDEESPVVCWCGARQIRFSAKSSVVWHIRSWYDGRVDG